VACKIVALNCVTLISSASCSDLFIAVMFSAQVLKNRTVVDGSDDFRKPIFETNSCLVLRDECTITAVQFAPFGLDNIG